VDARDVRSLAEVENDADKENAREGPLGLENLGVAGSVCFCANVCKFFASQMHVI
jgi:hypothetical protein